MARPDNRPSADDLDDVWPGAYAVARSISARESHMFQGAWDDLFSKLKDKIIRGYARRDWVQAPGQTCDKGHIDEVAWKLIRAARRDAYRV